MTRRRVAGIALLLLAGGATACAAITSIAVSGADFGGATADAHCDRRFVTGDRSRSAFCQEVVDTVAASQFADDCTTNFGATPGTGLCARAQILAGCKLDATNKDGSQVWDWYYDVTPLIADAGDLAGPDGGPTFAPPVPHSIVDVAVLCADPTRYAGGAALVLP